jgi:hypothetical protein
MSIEDNKLIAEFMGATAEQWYSKIENVQSGTHMVFPRESNYPDGKKHHTDSGLKYHKSFDWLMPVVEKIESLDLKEYFYQWEDEYGKHYNFEGICVEIEKNSCWIYANLLLDPSFDFAYNYPCDSKIEAVYKSVVEFIKWYNEK